MDYYFDDTEEEDAPELIFCRTEFKWVLTRWYDRFLFSTSLIRSDEFLLEDVHQSTGKLIFTEQDWPRSAHLNVEFSNPRAIVTVKASIKLNGGLPRVRKITEPASKVCPLWIIIPGSRDNVLYVQSDSVRPPWDSLIIEGKFEVGTYSTDPFDKNPNPTTILKKVEAMFANKTLCDMTFVVGDEELSAHKAILAAHSDVFEAMFRVPMREREKNVVEICDTTAEIFQTFLTYLYTGRVEKLGEVVQELMLVADKYQVIELKTLCENYLVDNLSEDNVAENIIIADMLSCAELKDRACDFLRYDPDVVMRPIIIQDDEHEDGEGSKKVYKGYST